jgi:outer membrane murein-binding lipoprotein Lpp
MDWTAIIIAFVAGGGLITVINGLFSRQKVLTDVESTKLHSQIEAFEIQVKAFEIQAKINGELIDRLEKRTDKLHARVDTLEADLEGSDMIVKKLNEENQSLHKELKAVKEENAKLVKDTKT